MRRPAASAARVVQLFFEGSQLRWKKRCGRNRRFHRLDHVGEPDPLELRGGFKFRKFIRAPSNAGRAVIAAHVNKDHHMLIGTCFSQVYSAHQDNGGESASQENVNTHLGIFAGRSQHIERPLRFCSTRQRFATNAMGVRVQPGSTQ
jgi:hypothetical protein